MKTISSDLFIVEPNETVTIKIEATNTPYLVNISLDGRSIRLQDKEAFHLQASPEKGTTHDLVFIFNFLGSGQASYQIDLKGSAGGSSKFKVNSGSGETISTRYCRFRVGSAEEGKLGIGPPSPWPSG